MESVMWKVAELVFAGINIALVYLFIYAFLKMERKLFFAVKVSVIFIGIVAKFFSSYFFVDNTIIHSAISIIVAVSIGFTFFKGKIYSIGIAALFATATGAVAEILAALMITTFHIVPIGDLHHFNIYRLQGRVLSNLLFLIIIILIRRFRATSMDNMSIRLTVTLCALPIASIILIQQFIFHLVATTNVPTTNEIITLLSILLINIFIFAMVENIIRKNEQSKKLILIEIQNDAYQRHIKQLMSYHLQIRKMSHDFMQKVQELYTLCAEEQYDALLSKLSELSNRSTKNLLADTGNLMLDSILTSKIEIAEKHNIDFKRKLDVQANLKYVDSEICALIGNALDNAIEACIRSNVGKFIGMELTATQGQFLCHIMNSVGKAPKQKGNFFKTAKEDTLHHGVGMQSMQQTCDDLGGYISYEFDDKYFKLWIKLSF